MERRFILWAAVLAVFTAAVEGTIVATAMPTIVADLGGLRLFTWVFAAYFLTQAVTIPIYGRLSDVIGRKKMFFVGTIVFLAGSILCGSARSMTALVAFRALQGIGAGGVQPVATTIVGDIYPGNERAKVQGYLSATWGTAAVIGPVLGAFLVERVSWSAVFWINVPIGIACLIVFGIFLKESLPARKHRIDYLGSLLLALGVGALILALTMAASLSAVQTAGLAALAALALVGLVVHERRVPEPLLPRGLLRNRVVAIGTGGNFTIGMLVMAVAAFIPTYVQGVLHGTAFLAGAVLAAMSVSWSSGSVIGGRLMTMTTYRRTAGAGGGMLILGTVLLVFLDPARGAAWAAVGGACIGLGFGLSNSSFLVSAQSSVGWEQRGAATGALLFMRQVGQAVGTALFGAVFNLAVFGRGGAAQALAAPQFAAMSAEIARGVHQIFVLAVVLAVGVFALAVVIPARLSAARQAA